jgi:hypothetical protein
MLNKFASEAFKGKCNFGDAGHLKKAVFEGVDWIQVAQIRIQSWTFVNTVLLGDISQGIS